MKVNGDKIVNAVIALLFLACVVQFVLIYYKYKDKEITPGKPWREVCLDNNIDTNTVGTTSDPTDEELLEYERATRETD